MSCLRVDMRQDERNFIRELDHLQQEAEKVRQLRELLHGHDLKWHQADQDEFCAASEREAFEELGSQCEMGGRRKSEDARSIGWWPTSTELHSDQTDGLDSAAGRPAQPFIDLKKDARHKFVRLLVTFCALFCNLDLFGGQIRARRRLQIGLFGDSIRLRLFRYATMSGSSWLRGSRWRAILPRLVLLLYSCSAAHLLYYLYHQYVYDYHRFRLMRVRWLNASHLEEALARKLPLEREHQLLERIRAGEQQIRRIGGPHAHLSFTVEHVYLMFPLTALVAHIFTQLYYKFFTPFDFYFLRNFIDYRAEQEGQRKLVREQVRHFIHSSRNYTRALAWFGRKSLAARVYFERFAGEPRRRSQRVSVVELDRHQRGERERRDSRRPQLEATLGAMEELKGAAVEEAVCLESFSCEQLRALLAGNHLRPMNQTRGWVAHQLHRYSALCVLCLLMAGIVDGCVIYLFFLFREPSRELSRADLTVGASLVWLLLICNVSTIFYTSVNVFTALDQAQLAVRLRQLMELVIDLNNLRFYRNLPHKSRRQEASERRRHTLMSLRQMSGQSEAQVEWRREQLHLGLAKGPRQLGTLFDASLENAMNRDMLLALMHYRIFVAGLAPLKRSLLAANLVVVSLMFLFPIINRLHMPYYNMEHIRYARSLTLILSLLVIVPVDINLIPVCHLHKRCMDLYEQLNGLLAHATEIVSLPEGRAVYDRHIVSILRKELRFAERTAAQFAIKLNNFTLTYPGLVRLHFYFGFIVLSIMSDSPASQQEVVGTLLQDPFGIF